ncbi:hypothetical protein RHSIM_Rhsim13G0160200 [Rhododendron simsii]|uniref:Gnk2-homologous domain-containing protein n=1 Tax=Rhododendron simsii TaxID=118357 RepID=A0A834L4K5_RHOSS|nr:hypothetical protein RHSIM_Rhsim13G0160200 [Rhododendron simsii]
MFSKGTKENVKPFQAKVLIATNVDKKIDASVNLNVAGIIYVVKVIEEESCQVPLSVEFSQPAMTAIPVHLKTSKKDAKKNDHEKDDESEKEGDDSDDLDVVGDSCDDNNANNEALFVYTIPLLSSLIAVIKADPTLLSVDCQNTTLDSPGTYAPNSTYQTNLNTLFSVLSSHSNNASNGFYNFTAGSGLPDDVAYGLFLCRGDVAVDACQGCVEYATGDVVEQCPLSKRANIWYDECLVRYSNVSIFAAADTTVWEVLQNPQNVTNNETRFREFLGEYELHPKTEKVMNNIANRASSDDSGKKFATGEDYYTPLQPVYGLAQCTPDLSNSDCNNCLRDGILKLPYAKLGAQVLFPSCYIRYEIYRFYNANFSGAPPPPSGYMSPEYAMHGQFSAKSDVFSFGVLVLEIISGKKNNNFYHSNGAPDLLSFSWSLWREGTPLDLMDPTLEGSHSRNEITRCIHIALLCVQNDPDARPSMARVVLMLNSYSSTLSLPQQPGFLGRPKTGSNSFKELESDQSTSQSIQWSMNEASNSQLDPR